MSSRHNWRTEWNKSFEGATARQDAMAEMQNHMSAWNLYRISHQGEMVTFYGVNENIESAIEEAFLELDVLIAEANLPTNPELSIYQRQALLLIKQLDPGNPVLMKIIQLLTDEPEV